MGSVLFVCTGNICRSPMAMVLFRDLIRDRPDAAAWRVESAGVWAGEGLPASSFSQAAMRERGLDLSAHRSRTVTGELLGAFNLILTMEQGQKEALLVEFPQLEGQVFLLGEMAGILQEVEDPYGCQHLADYVATAREIHSLLGAGLEKILQLAASPGS